MKESKIFGVKYFVNTEPWLTGTNEELVAQFGKVTRVSGFPKGPWVTKSDAELSVLFACEFEKLGANKSVPYLLSIPKLPELNDFFEYSSVPLDSVNQDIRGLRVYCIRSLLVGKEGGYEYHKIRDEVIFGLIGSVKVVLEDLAGNHEEYIIDSKHAVRIPAGVMHSYHVLEQGSAIFVLANTLFDAKDATTHDSYSLDDWENIK
ncbi:hypothetical protein CL619_02070 [archaeon]|nr:hypothetical protein [archaeon]|tara:strand:+ start:827 stop:1441 length:615 start_codon:yes stop_codon:yes gene_type:complete